MKRNKLNWIIPILLIGITSVSCKKSTFKVEPPLKRLNPEYTIISVNADKDSTYVLENGTIIRIPKGSLLDSIGNPIRGNVTIKYRQFDNAVSIFLTGLPMDYSYIEPNMALQTAGMFEIRGQNQNLKINAQKPITITLKSFFSDPRQGFFKLNEKNGQWTLIEIPEVRKNDELENLQNKLKTLKPEWTIPLGPNFYVFDYTRMADIFIGEDNWEKIYKAYSEEYENKMKKYGVNELNFRFHRIRIKYKGNYYDHSEILWKSNKPVNPPAWAKKIYFYLSRFENKTYKNIEIIDLKNNKYLFKFNNKPNGNDEWSMELEAVCHLRNLLKYTPEQLISRQAKIEKEIEEIERKIRNTRILEYTVELYLMGIYNIDRPVYFKNYTPELILKLDGKNITASDILTLAVFNSDLSSVAYHISLKPIKCPFFKGKNSILLVTKDGKLGLLTSKQFDKLINQTENLPNTLTIPLTKIEVENEKELMEKLKV